jgi:hypothetical protein
MTVLKNLKYKSRPFHKSNSKATVEDHFHT